jgi:hypothetical protein
VKAQLNGERRLECFRQRLLTAPASARDKEAIPVPGAQQIPRAESRRFCNRAQSRIEGTAPSLLETFDHWAEDALLRIRDFIDGHAHLVANFATLRAQVDDSDLVRT